MTNPQVNSNLHVKKIGHNSTMQLIIDNFTLLCNTSGSLLSSPDTDQTTQRSLEAYFQHDQQRHFFLLDQTGGGNSINREHFQTMEKIKLHFIYRFGKCKNEIKQSGKSLGLIFEHVLI
jgi:hypothetical protein